MTGDRLYPTWSGMSKRKFKDNKKSNVCAVMRWLLHLLEILFEMSMPLILLRSFSNITNFSHHEQSGFSMHQKKLNTITLTDCTNIYKRRPKFICGGLPRVNVNVGKTASEMSYFAELMNDFTSWWMISLIGSANEYIMANHKMLKSKISIWYSEWLKCRHFIFIVIPFMIWSTPLA